MTGRINSIQSLGASDGPGIRFVVFMQGCNLRCGCCHNPDTWSYSEGKEYTPTEIYEKAKRFREYFGTDGGITVSGGEPLLQAEFVRELFSLCRDGGINTCLDTSGSVMNGSVKKLLSVCDRVLLDVKYSTDEMYRKHVGCDLGRVLDFLEYLNAEKIPTTLRTVIIPTLNDNAAHIENLKELSKSYPCVSKIELLPFRKICAVKYESLKLPFAFAALPEPTAELMDTLYKML